MSTAACRQQLIDTAGALFAAREFRGTTARQLARAAGVTTGVGPRAATRPERRERRQRISGKI